MQNQFTRRAVRALAAFALALGLGTAKAQAASTITGVTVTHISTGSFNFTYGLPAGTTVFVDLSTNSAFTAGQLIVSATSTIAADAAWFKGASSVTFSSGTSGVFNIALAPNTSYYVRIGTAPFDQLSAGEIAGFNAGLATATLANSPVAASNPFQNAASLVSLVYKTSATVAYRTGFNPANVSTFSVVFTTGTCTPTTCLNQVIGSTVPAQSGVANGALTDGTVYFSVTGLLSNTTYTAWAASVNNNVAGTVASSNSYVSLGSTATAPSPAVVPVSFTALGSSSGTVVFTNSNSASSTATFTVLFTTGGCTSAQGCSGNVQVSTTASGGGAAAAATLTGLAANTSYNIFIDVANTAGNRTGEAFNTSIGSASTNGAFVSAVTPTFLSALLSSTSMSVNFNPNGNPFTPEVSSYTVTYSATSGDIVLTSTTPFATASLTQTTGSGLTPNTTYTLLVRTGNKIGGTFTADVNLGSTATLAALPLTNATTYFNQTSSSTGLSFATAGNPLSVTTYTLVASTSSAFTATGAANQVTLSTMPGAGFATISGLTPATTYFYRVRATNRNNVETDWASLGSTQTFAATPTIAAATTVGTSSFTANWGSASNPGTVPYVLEASTDSFATLVNSTLTYSTSFLFSNLTSGVTYAVRVRAKNQFGEFTPNANFAAVTTAGGTGGQTAPTAAASSATFILGGGTSGAGAGVVSGSLGTSQITAKWLSNGASQTVYRVQLSTVSDFATINYSSDTLNLFATFGPNPITPAELGTGINLANTTYYFRVPAGTATVGGNSSFVSLGSTVSLSIPPTASAMAATAIFRSSATLTWSNGVNPIYTVSEVQYSTAAAFGTYTSSKSAFGSPASSFINGLQGCTTYYARVRNVNLSDYATTFDTTQVFTTSNTIPAAASGFTATSLTSQQIQLDWGLAGNGVTRWNLYRASSGLEPSTGSATRLHVFGSSVTTYTDTLTIASAAYTYKLTAFGGCSEEDSVGALAVAAATNTLSALRAQMVAPVSGDNIIGGNSASASTSLTLEATLVSGSPTDVQTVTFQFKATTATAWADIGQAAVQPYIVKWNISSLAGGSALAVGQAYQVRALAYSTSGSSDTLASPVTFNVVTLGVVGATAEYIQGQVVTLVKTIDPVTPTAFTCSGGGNTVRIDVPAGAYDGNVTFTITPNPTALPAEPTEVRLGPGASAVRVSTFGVVEVVTQGGALRPGATIGIVLGYRDNDDNGVVDGTVVKVDNLRVLRAPTIADSYTTENIVATTVDTVKKKVTGITRATSFFAIFTVASADLSGVRVYPNPFKPNGTNADEGRPFTQGGANTGIVFDRLPANATIKIYTVTGQLVAEMTQDNGSGTVVWDTRNNAGRNTASGGYLAVISSPGRKSVVKRLAIIR